MKRVVAMVALGIGGFVAAIGLTVGALALTGDDTGAVVQPQLTESGSPSANRSDDDRGSATPSTSPDDHGGSGSDDAGSDDHSGSSGSGSGDDSGSGSSGSGSDDRSGSNGSGSGSSGSGSDDVDDD